MNAELAEVETGGRPLIDDHIKIALDIVLKLRATPPGSERRAQCAEILKHLRAGLAAGASREH